MKKLLFNFLMLLAVGSAVSLSSCSDDKGSDIVRVPAVDKYTPTPGPNSGENDPTNNATPGKVVTVTGVSLDMVSSVYIGDFEATILHQDITKIEFSIPEGDFPQDEITFAEFQVFGSNTETPAFKKNFWVFVPLSDVLVTSHSPLTGVTIGQSVTLEGRNLLKVNKVTVGPVTIDKLDFVSATDTDIEFALPPASYTPGDASLQLAAYWGDDNAELIINPAFLVKTPAPTPPAQDPGTHAVVGDEIVIDGTNLDMFTKFEVGGVEASIMAQSETQVTLKLQNGAYEAAMLATVVSVDIVGFYGTPEQTVTIKTGFQLDPSFVVPPVTAPTIASVVPEDGGAADDRFYLKKKVTVNGTDLNNVTAVTVGGLAATIDAGATGVKLVFNMPEDFTFNTATDVTLTLTYAGGTVNHASQIKVYPFYYWKDVTLGLGSNSNSTYTQFARDNSFFLFDSGEVISAQTWLNTPIDSYATTGSASTVVTTANTLTKAAITKTQYYEVTPYTFVICNSANTVSVCGPAGTANQLKNHRDGSTSVSATFGTPLIMFRSLHASDATDSQWADDVRNGTLQSVNYDGSKASTSGPVFLPDGTASNNWAVDGVLNVQYISYTKGTKPDAVTDNYKMGFIHVKEVTFADNSTGLANADRDGFIRFDCYWPKNALNAD